MDSPGKRLVEPKTWHRIEDVFLRAIDVPPEKRPRFLDSVCAGDAELRAEVDSLLAQDRGEDDALSHALAQEAALLLKPPVLEGQRMGSYRILSAIGRGGMGAVYLAVRDDHQYRQQVAIKIVRRGMDTSDVLRRFRHEREILALLEHPFIARLLDAGCTGDGRPFLVMELVEGQPIDQYCRERNLGIDERLRLFLQVCEAVSYAHRKLIVHRDLKPANILITGPSSSRSGSPKLLDFGLAKILDGDAASPLTALPIGPLTPEYASPEQVRGAALTTATDIYSLGVILHELLSGVRPLRLRSSSPAEWQRIVCETEVRPPSMAVPQGPGAEKWRRRLRGDLDNIVMLAMRKEPERRYCSVDEFAADIRRHLESHPVHARQDSLWYRSSKFVRRRRLPVLAAAAIAASLVFGIVLALNQAHEAEAARRIAVARESDAQRARSAAEAEHRRAEQERDTAVNERRRAEERLSQMVDLSDRALSEVYAPMERLAGGVPARRELIDTTLESLERLSKEAGGNPRLRVALAKAYIRLGDLEADPAIARTGRLESALKRYRAAEALLDAALPGEPAAQEGLLLWLSLQDKTSTLYIRMDRGSAAISLLQHAIDTTLHLPGSRGSSKDIVLARGRLYLALSKAIHPDLARSRPVASASLRVLAELAGRYPGEAEVRYDLSRAHTEMAYLLWNLEGPEAPAGHYLETIRIREQLVREHPTDMIYQSTLVGAYGHYANLQERIHKTEVAREYYRKAVALAELRTADPQNVDASIVYADWLLNLEALVNPPEGLAESLATMRKAIGILESAAAKGALLRPDLSLSEAYASVGSRLADMGQYTEAVAQYRHAQARAGAYLAAGPGDQYQNAVQRMFELGRGLSRVLTRAGNREAALQEAGRVVQLVEQARGHGAGDAFLESQSALAYWELANIHSAFQEWQPARAAAEEAVRHASLPSTGRYRYENAEILRDSRMLLSESASKTAAASSPERKD